MSPDVQSRMPPAAHSLDLATRVDVSKVLQVPGPPYPTGTIANLCPPNRFWLSGDLDVALSGIRDPKITDGLVVVPSALLVPLRDLLLAETTANPELPIALANVVDDVNDLTRLDRQSSLPECGGLPNHRLAKLARDYDSGEAIHRLPAA